MGYKLIDLTGKKFGRLTVVEKRPSVMYGLTKKRRWRCKCECGGFTEVDTGSLTSGHIKSCGCLHKESSVENSRRTRHLIAKKEAAFNAVKSIYKLNARKRGHAWLIDDAYARRLFSSCCHYCGQPPSNIYKNTHHKQEYSGIDRLDNSVGYTKKNTVSCCKICNHAKHTMDEKTFMDWLGRVFSRQKNLRRAIAEIDAQQAKQAGKPEGWHACGNVGHAGTDQTFEG